VYCQWQQKWEYGGWQSDQDNTSSHSAHLVWKLLAKHNVPQVRHFPYSLGIAPLDFFLFHKFGRTLKGKRVDDVETIEHSAMEQLLVIQR
jgi:hypothetical protein